MPDSKKETKDNKKKKEPKKLLIAIVAILVCLVIGASLFLAISNNSDSSETVTDDPYDILEEIESIISEEDIQAIEDYDDYALYSSMFDGIIRFDSNMINLPFVQGPDNNFFLRRDWKTNDDSVLGSIFMDYECNLNSQNIILYGHNAFSYYDAGNDENGNPLVNDELMFTPLKFLIKEDNYEANKDISLILENEVREYEIVAVYYCPLEGEGDALYPKEGYAYYYPEYTEEYFNTYKENVKSAEFYDTGVDFTYEDKYLTLQTCVEGNDMVREIVLCKLVSTRPIDREAYDLYKNELTEYNTRLEQEQAEESEKSDTVTKAE